MLQIAIRRKLRCGPNFDLATNRDLTDEKQRRLVKQYFRKQKPRVVVMGPPCTMFGTWAIFNDAIARRNPTQWKARCKRFRLAVKLAEFAAWAALEQLNNGRDFLCENPAESRLWKLACWLLVLRHPRVCQAYLEQCMVGLVCPDCNPTLKPTLFVGSDECLVERLRLTCNGFHEWHQPLKGSSKAGLARCAFAQTWTRQLCELIVQGCIAAINKQRQRPTTNTNYNDSTYAAGDD